MQGAFHFVKKGENGMVCLKEFFFYFYYQLLGLRWNSFLK